MLTDGVRTCDVCDESIDRGAVFYRSICRPEAAALLASSPDPPSTFTRNADGTVTLDVCLDCCGNMGQATFKLRRAPTSVDSPGRSGERGLAWTRKGATATAFVLVG